VRCAAALCAAGAVLLSGCGDLPDEPAVEGPGRHISARQVAAQPPGSPQRAVLQWLLHLQRSDTSAALRDYASSVSLNRSEMLFMRAATRTQFRYLGPPKVLDVERRGSEATVYTMLQSETKAPNGRLDVSRRPRAFHVKLEDGRWKLSDNLWLAFMAKSSVSDEIPDAEEKPQ
jgi:hypothetical protein